MGVPVLEGFTSDSHNGTGPASITLNKPAGTATGDLLVIITADDDASGSDFFITPSGFTRRGKAGDTSSDTTVTVYTREVDGTEGASFTVTDDRVDSFLDLAGVCLRVSNYDSYNTGSFFSQSAATTFDFTDVTTTAADVLLIGGVSFDGADSSPLFTAITDSFTKETEFNTRGTGGFGTTLGVFTKSVTATGTYGATVTADASDGMAGALIAIAGASGPPVTYEDITLVASQYDEQASNSTDLTFPVSGDAAGDFGVLIASSDAQNAIALAITLSGVTGWTNQLSISTTAGRDRDSELWTKVFGASEPTASVTINEDFENAGILGVFRGVDQTTPLDAAIASSDGQNNANPTPPGITTVTDGAAIIAILSLSNDDVTVPGPPTGYTLAESSTAQDRHRQVYMAYLLDAGTAGAKTVPAWTHTTDASIAEYHAITMALRPAEAPDSVDLLANDVSSTSNVTTPAITQTHGLLANDVQSNSSVSAPSVAQVHILAGEDVQSASTVSTPSLSENNSLAAIGVGSESEVTSPAIEQVHALTANDTQAQTEVTAPALTQVHALTGVSVSSATEVSNPAASTEGTDGLSAADVEAQSEVTAPEIGQVHSLAAIEVGSESEVTSPALGQTHSITATGAAAASEVSAPSLVELFGTPLNAENIDAQAEVSAPSIGQVHTLTAPGIAAQSHVSTPGLNREEDQRQPGGFLPIKYLDAQGNETDPFATDPFTELEERIEEAIEASPAHQKPKVKQAARRVAAAYQAGEAIRPQWIDTLERAFARIEAELVLQDALARMEQQNDEEAIWLLMVA